jgi:cytochrome P450
VFSADGTPPGFPMLLPGQAQILRNPPFIRMDPPQHSFYRRMLIQELTVKRIKTMRPGIQATVDRLLDDLPAQTPPMDLVEAFALPVPSLVICQLLGVPYDDHEFFQSRSKVAMSGASTGEQFATALG